ncbi:MAG: pyridoxine 5'-phosphate synthase [Planctomycetes bacterium]|nr:pyridoxine 5'-phosphate synthase [Planctomycetota bacterium]
MTELGVNIDHVATVRNARGGREPSPVAAALISETAGADSIVCHLREDRRHIRDDDVRLINDSVTTSLQLEMSLDDGVINAALQIAPPEVMIVPERREELTTEGGFDCIAHSEKLSKAVSRFADAGIDVSVFIDADKNQISAAMDMGVSIIELHTGPYSHAHGGSVDKEIDKLLQAAAFGWELGLSIHAGHGLNYINVRTMLEIVPVEKVNIGHAIISRAIFVGLREAVAEMKRIVSQ